MRARLIHPGISFCASIISEKQSLPNLGNAIASPPFDDAETFRLPGEPGTKATSSSCIQ